MGLCMGIWVPTLQIPAPKLFRQFCFISSLLNTVVGHSSEIIVTAMVPDIP
jgi:hypothetical protein